MNSQDNLKKAVAIAALKEIQAGSIIGVGSGSTIQFFIEVLSQHKELIKGAVPSSKATEALLKAHQIPILNVNEGVIETYIDSADECNHHCQLIKGGGGALTREKILAAMTKHFVCIIDESKYVKKLGEFPLAIEVIPMARSYVAREMIKLGGNPIFREEFVTDNGNQIIDIHQLEIMQPIAFEEQINHISGVVCNGLFAKRGADKVLIGTQSGIEIVTPR